jgi:hypothetical protein
MAWPRSRTVCPNRCTGRFASVSAERPTRKTPSVKTAVRAGDENDAKSVATATTIDTSQTVSAADAMTSCRSGPAGMAIQVITAKKARDQGITTKTRL